MRKLFLLLVLCITIPTTVGLACPTDYSGDKVCITEDNHPIVTVTTFDVENMSNYGFSPVVISNALTLRVDKLGYEEPESEKLSDGEVKFLTARNKGDPLLSGDPLL